MMSYGPGTPTFSSPSWVLLTNESWQLVRLEQHDDFIATEGGDASRPSMKGFHVWTEPGGSMPLKTHFSHVPLSRFSAKEGYHA